MRRCLSALLFVVPVVGCVAADDSGADRPTGTREDGSRASMTWAPDLSSDCHALALSAAPWRQPTQGNDCAPGGGFWLLSTTTEDLDFRNQYKGVVHMDDFRPRSQGEADSPWEYGFYPRGDGRYRLGWVVDKVNFPKYVDRHTGAFLNDSFDANSTVARPNVGNDLVLDVDLRLRASEGVSDDRTVTVFEEPNWDQVISDPAGRVVGEAKNRVTVGITARSKAGVLYFVEINLYRTPNWDLVNDPADLYERQGNWDLPGFGTGQLVYYNGVHLSRVPGVGADLPALTPEPDGPMRHFTIPISTLFTSYAWPYPVGSWSDVEIAGIYIGTEIWGRGRVWFELEGYNLHGSSGSGGGGGGGGGDGGGGGSQPGYEGVFRVGEGLFYSNGSAYCQYDTWANFTCGTGLQSVDTVTAFSEVPADLIPAGLCQVTPCEESQPAYVGVFRVGEGLFYSNGSAYCQYDTWPHFECATGVTDFNAVTTFPSVPGGLESHGVCQIPENCL